MLAVDWAWKHEIVLGSKPAYHEREALVTKVVSPFSCAVGHPVIMLAVFMPAPSACFECRVA